jgi:hypothetical protein
MTQKQNLRVLLIFSLFFLSLGGWLLHSRIHPLIAAPGNVIPAVSGMFSLIVITLLFCFRRTVSFGYVLNGITVIIGTIAMAHFSLKHPPAVWTLQAVLFKTLLADIALLWGKFAAGKALFELELVNNPENAARKGRFFRYPNMGWWWIHLVALGVVYTLGYQIWQ